MYFQHEGAPPHSSREVRNFLNYRFPGRLIVCGGPHNWPARSPELSPLDYCEWGWMKELVYSVKVLTQDAGLAAFWMPQTASETASGSCNVQRAVHNRAAAYVAASGGIFENQL